MIICGTGHRPDKLGGYGQDVTDKLISLATDALEELHPEQVISGMALGWDQALATAAIRLDNPVLAAVPFKGQESTWNQESQDIYNSILAKCKKVAIISDGGYTIAKMMLRNNWMVDNSTHVLALWNGSRGGTYQTVKYAQKVGKPIRNLWNKFIGIHDENDLSRFGV